MTNHKLYFSNAKDLSQIGNNSIELIVTSPPYPMIEMWDKILFEQNAKIKEKIQKKMFNDAFELMHHELDIIWKECFRVLKEGGIACINIGDATRTFNQNFRLFSNHSRIINSFIKIGFQNLPNIIWRKQTNAPNKFMGSGMLPPGAYVTLEHEYILIFRKGKKREFKSSSEKIKRKESSFFWEERNIWFSDVWDFKGTNQKIFHNNSKARERSAAYPFELPYRLINMFSVQGDFVLDPFIGTGTTTLAAIASKRNSIGFEIDLNFKDVIKNNIIEKEKSINDYISNRLQRHILFVEEGRKIKGKNAFKYSNLNYEFPVMTRQEQEIKIPFLKNLTFNDVEFQATYFEEIELLAPNSFKLF